MVTDISVSSHTTPAPAGGTLTYTTQAAAGATGSHAKTTKLTAVSPSHTAAPTDTVTCHTQPDEKQRCFCSGRHGSRWKAQTQQGHLRRDSLVVDLGQSTEQPLSD